MHSAYPTHLTLHHLIIPVALLNTVRIVKLFTVRISPSCHSPLIMFKYSPQNFFTDNPEKELFYPLN